jgi:3-dehydroquinate synthase
VSSEIFIKSHKGLYSISFEESFLHNAPLELKNGRHFIIDSKIAQYYPDAFQKILAHSSVTIIEATEGNKSIENLIGVFNSIVNNGVRRDHSLIAIGGGVIQDITCFIASTLLRGVSWEFIPTTLLSQADSCIGSKSSINLGKVKNILGTFYPPKRIYLYTKFLDTLENQDILSGIGEIIKVHAISGHQSFDALAEVYEELLLDRQLLAKYIFSALDIKRKYIEIDEFDCNERLIFNYGHTFGHAIESATNFAIPHGVAVSIGMDMANYLAMKMGKLTLFHYERMHKLLFKNYKQFSTNLINYDLFIASLIKDKKHTSSNLMLVLPVGDEAKIQLVPVVFDNKFTVLCKNYLNNNL